MQVTARDLPTQSDRQTSASRKSEDLYFGFDSPPDPVQARKCPYIEREQRADANDEVFGASGLAQRAWLSYREAWVRFGRRRYPSVAGASWRTWLTRERIEMLQPNDAKCFRERSTVC
jgi:hypothetical protein